MIGVQSRVARSTIGLRNLPLAPLLLLAVAAVTVYLVLAPLLMTLVSMFKAKGTLPFEPSPLTLENFSKVFLDPNTYLLLQNTLVFATGSLAIGFSLAILISWLIERTDIPFRELFYSLLLIPMAIPGMLSAISWILLLSPRIGFINQVLRGVFQVSGEGPLNIYTIAGMFFVEGIRMVPTLFLMLSGAFRNMDPALEEASKVSGVNSVGTLFGITLPIMRPALLAALVYYFIVAIEAFEIPGVIGLSAGLQVFSTRIYWVSHPDPGLPNYGEASTLALIIILAAIGLNRLYNVLTKQGANYTTITGKGYRARRIPLGKWRVPAVLVLVGYLLIAVLLPVFIMFWATLHTYYQAPSWDGLQTINFSAYTQVWQSRNIAQAVWNSLIMSLAAATVTMFLVTIVAWIVVRSRVRGRLLLGQLAVLPQAMPSIIVGLAVMILYVSFPNPFYGTIWVIMIALTTRYLAFGSRTMNASLLQIHPELEEASQVSGVGWGTGFLSIVLPLVAPAFVNGWIWVAIHSLREVSAAMMLSSPNNIVISTMIWQLWSQGHTAEASVLGLMLIAALATLTLGGRLILLRKIRSF